MNFHAGDQFTDPNTDEVFLIQEKEEIIVYPFKSSPFTIYAYFLQGNHGNEHELNHCELVDLIINDKLIEEL